MNRKNVNVQPQNIPLRVAGLVALFSVLNLLRVLASLS